MIVPPISQLQSHHSLVIGAGPIGHILKAPWQGLGGIWHWLSFLFSSGPRGAFKTYIFVSLSYSLWTGQIIQKIEAEELFPNLIYLSLLILGKPFSLLQNTGVLEGIRNPGTLFNNSTEHPLKQMITFALGDLILGCVLVLTLIWETLVGTQWGHPF